MAKIGHNAWAIAFAKCSVCVKNYNSKKHVKNHSRSTLELFGAKKGFKKHLIFENWQLFQNGHNWSQNMGYSLWKMLSLGPKLKFKTHVKHALRSTLELFCAKKGLKKHLIFEKWQVFENGQNWSQCMGYSLCKMFSLGPKLKFKKTFEKRL